MASLTGSTIASSYEQLLSLPDGGLNGTTLVAITDGDSSTAIPLQVATDKLLITDDVKLYFGTGSDASFEYDEDGNDVLLYDGANFRINDDTQLQFGAAADWTVEYDEDGNDDLVFTGSDMAIESSTASKPVLHITNTHAGATAGEIRFNKDSASGADNDVMGTISWYGTDDDDNTHERLAYMDTIITDSAEGSEAASMRFYVAENDATLTQGLALAGQADANGEVDVTIGAGAASTCTVAGLLTVTGGGIAFPATQVASSDANTLDDYEEGTWTPVLSDGSNVAAPDTDQAIGTYTKIGDSVTLRWWFDNSDLQSVSGGVRFTGLPFTSKNSPYDKGVFTAGVAASLNAYVQFSGPIGGYCSPNTSYILLENWDLATGSSEMQHDEFGDAGKVAMFGNYHTA